MSTEYQPPKPPVEHHTADNAPDAPDYSEAVDVGGIHAVVGQEKTAPASGEEPLPLWLWAAILLLIFWSGGYLFAYSGGFSGTVYDASEVVASSSGGKAAPGAPGAAAEAPKAEDPVALGQRFFTQTCVACHQSTGLGQPGTYPPLAGSEYAQGDERRVAAIVLHGVQGPITVHGAQFNNQMQAWGPTLNDKRIAYILTYVRQAWGNKGGPITPELVAEVRKATASRTTAWTEAELKAFK